MASTNTSNGCIRRAGPGPQYMLPPTVGYERHDITRDRRPAFSIGSRIPTKCKDFGPGPSILVEKYDRFGSTATPAFTIAPLLKPPRGAFDTPGPGSYLPEIPRDAPAFSLKSRTPLPQDKSSGPGPNAYLLPSSLHGTIEHLGQRLPMPEKSCSPGPAKYHAPLPKKGPMFSFGLRISPPQDSSVKPGPATYLPAYNTYRNTPMYSFGLKHSECKTIPMTDADKYPDCEDIEAA